MTYDYKIIKYEPTGFWKNGKHFLIHGGAFALGGDDHWVLIEHNGKRFWESIEVGRSYSSIEDQIQHAIYWKFYRKNQKSKELAEFFQLHSIEKGEDK